MGFFSRGKSKIIPTSVLPEAYKFSSESLIATSMSTTSNSTSGSRPTSGHDTGFPESFASCTTSMRHPDAIIDSSFAICAEHIDPANTLHRSRKSLLRKHRRTISHGKIGEGSFGQDYAGRSASVGASATSAIDQKAEDVGVAVAQSSGSGTETPDRAKDPDDIFSLSAGFRYTNSGEHTSDERRGPNVFRKLINQN